MSIKNKIFKYLDEHGFITDSEVAKLYGKEPNWATVEEYKRQWLRLQRDREFFQGMKITHAYKVRGRAVVDIKNNDDSYIVGKEFFEEIIKDMVVDTSRPDLKLKMYRAKK